MKFPNGKRSLRKLFAPEWFSRVNKRNLIG